MPVLLNDTASLTVNQFRRYIAYNALDQRAILIAGFGGKLGRQLCGLRRGIQVEGLIFPDKAVGAFRDFVGAAVIDNGFYLRACRPEPAASNYTDGWSDRAGPI